MAKTEMKIRELVDKVMRKELILPEMQRRYVWPATRVRDLLDSLYRGYPSGAILTWETDEDIETKEMAVKGSEIPLGTTRLLLLDGQQRLTSLTAIITGEPLYVRNKPKPIDILFNLDHPDGPPIDIDEVDEEGGAQIDDDDDDEATVVDVQEEMKRRTFVVGSRALKNNPTWVSVSDIFRMKDKDILRPIGINSDEPLWDKYTERLGAVRDILKYTYTVQVLEKSKSYKEVAEIFVRVNSLGVKLRGSDLAVAQITAKWKGFIKALENYVGKFEEDADYIYEAGLPIRTMVAFATGQCRFESVGRITLKKLQHSWDETDDSLKYAYDFIRNNAEVDAIGQLSSPYLLVPLAYYAWQQDQKVPKGDAKKLLEWFFYANMRGHYSIGSSESILDADLNGLKKGGIDELMKILLLHIRKYDLEPDEVAGKNVNNAMFYMYYLALKKKSVQDWRTAQKLSNKNIGKNYKIEYDHIFPKALLREMKYSKKEINEIANFAFISAKANRTKSKIPPNEYLAKVVDEHGERMLADHLIPTNRKLWELDAYPEFLKERRRLITKAINEHIHSYID